MSSLNCKILRNLSNLSDVDGKTRAYNAQRIKMSTLSRAQYSQLKAAYRGNNASSVDAISVADLVTLVKTYDNINIRNDSKTNNLADKTQFVYSISLGATAFAG